MTSQSDPSWIAAREAYGRSFPHSLQPSLDTLERETEELDKESTKLFLKMDRASGKAKTLKVETRKLKDIRDHLRARLKDRQDGGRIPPSDPSLPRQRKRPRLAAPSPATPSSSKRDIIYIDCDPDDDIPLPAPASSN